MPYIVISILALLVAALVSNRVRPAVAFVVTVGCFIAFGFISFSEALGNVVNPALVSLVLLMLISLALEKTPFVSGLGERLFNTGYRRSVGVCLLLSAALLV